MSPVILEIALPTPLRRVFDYLPPPHCPPEALRPGLRLKVPFGRREVIGVLLGVKHHTELAREQLRAARRLLDPEPLIDEPLLRLTRWAAEYYCHPIGEAIFHALPPALRRGNTSPDRTEKVWRLSTLGAGLPEQGLRRAPRQQQAIDYLLRHGRLRQGELSDTALSPDALRTLVQRGLVQVGLEAAAAEPEAGSGDCQRGPAPALNAEQAEAVATIATGLGRFAPYLLEGITGSGKTEVYLQAIDRVLGRGEQALVLVPEIGLTGQTIGRFRQRFGAGVVTLHSGLSEGERLRAWQQAAGGLARVVIGTRSAVFSQLPRLGLIVVDEEHDPSYKQQDGFRYSARDVAVKRAHMAGVPIVLGSATPSCESLQNVHAGRYQTIALAHRAGDAAPPGLSLLDLRGATLREGCCDELVSGLEQTISRDEQALVYINRRGYAPTLICHQCGWVAQCQQCDARTVVYRKAGQLKCHLCESRYPLPTHCPDCGGRQLQSVGQGTERCEAFLQQHFASTPVLRIDRDTTRRKGAMDQFVEQIQAGGPAILVGTQMLAKGHHFPNVTLVGIIDADAGLCSADFRGPERTTQMLLQVAGRAGRASKPGRVMIQTHCPEHPLLQLLVRDRYRPISDLLLNARRPLGLPPFGYLAMVRCDAQQQEPPRLLLQELRAHLLQRGEIDLVGPLAPPISRLAGRFRWQLLLKQPARGALHRAVRAAIQWLERAPGARNLRWSVDIDPQDFL